MITGWTVSYRRRRFGRRRYACGGVSLLEARGTVEHLLGAGYRDIRIEPRVA